MKQRGISPRTTRTLSLNYKIYMFITNINFNNLVRTWHIVSNKPFSKKDELKKIIFPHVIREEKIPNNLNIDCPKNYLNIHHP